MTTHAADEKPEVPEVQEAPVRSSASPLDEIDEQLVLLLQQDGRISYSDLGAAVGLTSGGARMRVKRLEERGILKVIGVTSAYELGLRSIASVQIRIDGDVDEVADRISELDGVRYLVLGSGSFDLLVEAYATTPAELYTLIHRRIRRVPGVRGVETFLYDSVHTHRPVFSLSARNGASPG